MAEDNKCPKKRTTKEGVGVWGIKSINHIHREE